MNEDVQSYAGPEEIGPLTSKLPVAYFRLSIGIFFIRSQFINRFLCPLLGFIHINAV
ncbi:MAG: hypothetical protein ACJAYG_000738 [Oceanicoccus sp.]|jgi:hypothetical protein